MVNFNYYEFTISEVRQVREYVALHLIARLSKDWHSASEMEILGFLAVFYPSE